MIRTAILACSIIAGGVLGGGTAGLVGRSVAPVENQQAADEREQLQQIAALLQKISLQVEPVAHLASTMSNSESQRQNDINSVLKSMPTK
jgi:hypothetical protein